MVTDQQVRRLFKLVQTEKNFGIAAIKAGMDEKTARKYRKAGELPSVLKKTHTWRTRKDPFEDTWDEIKSMLEINPGLEAKTIFEDLQRRTPHVFVNADQQNPLPNCRGRPKGISRISQTRPGLSLKTTTRSARRTDSAMLWVTKRKVLRSCAIRRSRCPICG